MNTTSPYYQDNCHPFSIFSGQLLPFLHIPRTTVITSPYFQDNCHFLFPFSLDNCHHFSIFAEHWSPLLHIAPNGSSFLTVVNLYDQKNGHQYTFQEKYLSKIFKEFRTIGLLNLQTEMQ